MSKTYHLWTIGCQMNEADSRHLGSQLEALGYRESPSADDADLVVLNTCVVRQQAEDKAVGRLSSLQSAKARRPDMVVGLMGCMVGMREEPRLRKRFPFVDVFMPPSETGPLLEFLAEQGAIEESVALETRARAIRDAIQDEEHILPALRRGATVTANVPVVLGCSHACTFCVIPYRRGAERSVPRGQVLAEVRALVDQGVREVMLLGQIVDRYGADLPGNGDLADLLRDVAAIDGLHRVRFLTSHPNWMTSRLLDTIAEVDKICPHIEVPVQAGNDEILAAMRRGYTVAQYRDLIARIRARLPHTAINTDIIVGFPGETVAQFEDTYRLLQELRLDKIHIAKYSERPKTVAARSMPDEVSDEEKERRRRRLEDLQAEVLTEKNRRYLDRTVSILVEGLQRGRWRGRTPDNRLAFFAHDRDLRGSLVDVRITWTGPFSLRGELAHVHNGAAAPTPLATASTG
jgi:tRNA-2-methylthio-N6-dimethylallyladenosine synthase